MGQHQVRPNLKERRISLWWHKHNVHKLNQGASKYDRITQNKTLEYPPRVSEFDYFNVENSCLWTHVLHQVNPIQTKHSKTNQLDPEPHSNPQYPVLDFVHSPCTQMLLRLVVPYPRPRWSEQSCRLQIDDLHHHPVHFRFGRTDWHQISGVIQSAKVWMWNSVDAEIFDTLWMLQ